MGCSSRLIQPINNVASFSCNYALFQMQLCVSEMNRVLKSGGFCAVIIGESRAFPGAAHAVLMIFDQFFRTKWGPIFRNKELSSK